jgi:hypothetical protein
MAKTTVNKTQATAQSVSAFLDAIPDETKRKDAKTVAKMMKAITGEAPKMWGPSIVGFGKYHYKYDSGHEGDMCVTGFSPRAAALTLYIVPGFLASEPVMKRLGKFKTGKSCLYIKKLSDIDMKALEELVAGSVAYMRAKYKS